MLYVIHERWYAPHGTRCAQYRPMSFGLALATLYRWRAMQPSLGGGLSDYWMVPA